MAGVYTGEAISVLVAIMRRKKASDAVRLAAARELLDRACGRPGQALTGETRTTPVSFTLIEELYPNG